mgnify:CR=1 FL=1
MKQIQLHINITCIISHNMGSLRPELASCLEGSVDVF